MTTDVHSDSSDQTRDEPLYIEGEDHLEAIVDEDDLVLVDFFAEWCGPCKMIAPVLETLAAETDATIAKVDVDNHQQLAGSFGVRGVPTLVIFSDGQQVEEHTGALPAEQLRMLIERYN